MLILLTELEEAASWENAVISFCAVLHLKWREILQMEI